MPKAIKFVLLPLILLAILALPSSYGCGGGDTTTTAVWAGTPIEQLTQQQLQQLLADSIDKYEKLNTYRFDIIMVITTNVTGGSNPMKTLFNTTMKGGTNIATDQTQMSMSMLIGSASEAFGYEEQSLGYDLYAMPDWLYLKMSITNMPDQWVKIKTSSDIKEFLKFDSIDQEMLALESPSKIEYLETEQFNGVDCYVLSVSPSHQQLAEWLKGQNGNLENMDWENLLNNPNNLLDFSLIYFVAKDTNLMMFMATNMTVSLSPAEAGVPTQDFDNMSMNIITEMTLLDHNQEFSVTIPDEAKLAKEVSEDIFLSK
jgi:hypothetical protein